MIFILFRFFREITIKDLDYIFIPINITQQHWLILVILLKKNLILYFDSFYDEIKFEITNKIEKYLNEKLQLEINEKLEYINFKVLKIESGKQPTGNDCGPCIILFVEKFLKNLNIKMELNYLIKEDKFILEKKIEFKIDEINNFRNFLKLSLKSEFKTVQEFEEVIKNLSEYINNDKLLSSGELSKPYGDINHQLNQINFDEISNIDMDTIKEFYVTEDTNNEEFKKKKIGTIKFN